MVQEGRMVLTGTKLADRVRQLFLPSDMGKGLWPMDLLVITYAMLTLGFTAVLWHQLANPWSLVTNRITVFILIAVMWGIYRIWPTRLMSFFRISLQMTLLNLWYPETYEFNCIRPNLDHVFAKCDAILFGCQPSLEFSRLCPWEWFCEAVNMGYFSYYPMILLVMMFFAFCRYKKYERASFVVMCSFFIFYFIYIFLPVAGPQFYFWAVGTDTVANGIFPQLGTYFSNHTEMLTAPGNPNGLFYGLVNWAQETGEHPTAAFPSSHIGITLILLYLVYPESKKLFYILLPFSVLLALATVYIQAHYLIDAFAGVLTSIPVFFLSQWLYNVFFNKESGTEHHTVSASRR